MGVCWKRSPTASLAANTCFRDEKKKKLKSNGKNDMRGQAYKLKALELAHLTIPSVCQSTHRGCHGIGCQLHPLKETRIKHINRHNLSLCLSFFLSSVCLSSFLSFFLSF